MGSLFDRNIAFSISKSFCVCVVNMSKRSVEVTMHTGNTEFLPCLFMPSILYDVLLSRFPNMYRIPSFCIKPNRCKPLTCSINLFSIHKLTLDKIFLAAHVKCEALWFTISKM